MELGSDDYYVKSNVLASRPEREQLVYKWQTGLERTDDASWRNPYNNILIANLVLEGLERVSDGATVDKQMLRGEALFVRGYALFYLSQLFCKPYRHSTRLDGELGLPLRTSSDHAQYFGRSGLGETFNFIISGLEAAAELLPVTAQFKSRPSKLAALSALARVQLSLSNYGEAANYAQQALSYQDELIDYNTLDSNLRIPFEVAHPEVIYYAFCNSGYLLGASRSFITKELYDSYEQDDLRKKLFFNRSAAGDVTFRGNYDGVGGTYFSGLATDENYLILAECLVRTGKVAEGVEYLNKLLVKRYASGTFTPHQPDLSEQDALDIVLAERRKELLRRGLRWIDLRRMAQERTEDIIRKVDDGITDSEFKLGQSAVDLVYPIPSDVIRLGGYEQNPTGE